MKSRDNIYVKDLKINYSHTFQYLSEKQLFAINMLLIFVFKRRRVWFFLIYAHSIVHIYMHKYVSIYACIATENLKQNEIFKSI